ncbi:YheC/YheD family endospore coat-associated protein [Haloplasma contractile]|uniref:YheC/D like ATP-grasp protein n=1 Tax=Haloplasma contractile SSD-17B TaxID=1033810 RepID=U2DRC0_9MOLU|nr:YheC/YheD family protein [Haloplasma contractile]ERJ11122.1 YheC/D like ATP-grasp protein [Haloplasma contractile SSD-17B]
MTLIGMLHHRKRPQKVTKSYAYAAVAKAEGSELLYFSPKMVDFKKRVINGFIYKDGGWKQIESRFPDVIYNAGSPIKLNRSKKIITRLKEHIPFTTHSIGNKMSVYNRIQKEGEFSNYLIPSSYVKSAGDVLGYLEHNQKIVFKPVKGHKGEGITFIEEQGEDYYTKSLGSNKREINYKELIDYIQSKIEEDLYLVQPYINSKTKSGHSYDVRSHIQKDGNNNWVITSIYPRINLSDSIITNINSGGATNYLVPFLKQEFGDEYYDVKQYLERFSLQLASHMEEIQKKYFDEQIDEIGIDIGLDKKKKIWVYEVNWRPGCPPAFYLELDVVKNMIQYCLYLAKKR